MDSYLVQCMLQNACSYLPAMTDANHHMQNPKELRFKNVLQLNFNNAESYVCNLKKKCASEFVQQIEKLLADLLYLFF